VGVAIGISGVHAKTLDVSVGVERITYVPNCVQMLQLVVTDAHTRNTHAHNKYTQ
jgi:hypothetical protein